MKLTPKINTQLNKKNQNKNINQTTKSLWLMRIEGLALHGTT
jgi:hypothetical protein